MLLLLLLGGASGQSPARDPGPWECVYLIPLFARTHTHAHLSQIITIIVVVVVVSSIRFAFALGGTVLITVVSTAS